MDYKIGKGTFPTSYGSWKKLEIAELKAFYGVRTFIEQFCRDRQSSIWSKTQKHFLLYMPGPSEVFRHKRYKQIAAALHYCDENLALPREHVDYDRLYKVRLLLNELKVKFEKYYQPGCEISIDECMVPFQGRWGGKQYHKDKPVKWGVKVWMMCDAKSGYNLNFDVYAGKEKDLRDHITNMGLASGVVLKLAQLLYGKGHIIYTDRFYTSPHLLHMLRQVDLSGCGTAMTNRKYFPKEIIKPKKECREQSASEWRRCSKTGIVATRWTDRSPIYFLSNAHLPYHDDCTVERTEKSGSKVTVDATPSVKEYNEFMGGVDLNDKMCKLDKSRKSYKWYIKIDRKAVMWAMYNGYVLYKERQPKTEYRTFMLDVIHALIGDNRPSPQNPQPGTSSSHTPTVDVTSYEKRCMACSKAKRKPSRTTFMCAECGVHLCIKRGSTCWQEFHS